MFSSVVTGYWDAKLPRAGGTSGGFSLTLDPALREDRRVMVLDAGDTVRAVLTPAVARQAEVSGDDKLSALTASEFRRALGEAGVTLYGADRVHYFLEADKPALMHESAQIDVRRLAEGDAEPFAEFEASAPAQDLDDAYVELDHWAVFGAFVQGRLVSAASAYPWDGAQIADVGVLTLPEFRGHGHARAVVRALCRYAARQGYEPQYRCQFDNEPSIALARSAGLSYFGSWEVVSPS